jgi:hypothetical protein
MVRRRVNKKNIYYEINSSMSSLHFAVAHNSKTAKTQFS